jgi:hypothetical protein
MAHSADESNIRWHRTGGATIGTVVDALAFACELAMIVILGIAGWSLGSGGLLSMALMIFYPALAILIWAVWVAPKAGRRLGDPLRLGIQLALFAGTAALSAAGRHVLLGVVFGAVAWIAFIASRFTATVTGAATGPEPDAGASDAQAGSSGSDE